MRKIIVSELKIPKTYFSAKRKIIVSELKIPKTYFSAKRKIIIGLVGETGSGKDTFCRFVKKNYSDVFCFRFSQPLTEALGIFFDQIKKEDQQWLALALRKRYGKDILGSVIYRRIKKIKSGIIILNGIRVWEEYRMLKKLGAEIVYITAPSQSRWRRIRVRGEKKDDNASFEKFLKIDKSSVETSIGNIGKKADFRIENNRTKKDFFKKVKQIMEGLNLELRN